MAVCVKIGSWEEAWERPVQVEEWLKLQQMVPVGPQQQVEAAEGREGWAAWVEGAEIVWVGAAGLQREVALERQAEVAWVMSSEVLWDLAVWGEDPEAALLVCFGVLVLQGDYQMRDGEPLDEPLL